MHASLLTDWPKIGLYVYDTWSRPVRGHIWHDLISSENNNRNQTVTTLRWYSEATSRGRCGDLARIVLCQYAENACSWANQHRTRVTFYMCPSLSLYNSSHQQRNWFRDDIPKWVRCGGDRLSVCTLRVIQIWKCVAERCALCARLFTQKNSTVIVIT